MAKILSEIDVRKRREQLGAEIDELQARIELCEAERARLDLIIDAIVRYGAEDHGSEAAAEESSPVTGTTSAEEIVRPEGIPTTRQMVLSVVRDANLKGKGPTLAEIIDGVRRNWWPKAPGDRIRPMVWTLWKEKGVLKRLDDRYFVENGKD